MGGAAVVVVLAAVDDVLDAAVVVVVDVVVVSSVESGVLPGVVDEGVGDVVVVVEVDVVDVLDVVEVVDGTVSGVLSMWTAAAELGHPNQPVSRIDWQKATSPRTPALLPSDT